MGLSGILDIVQKSPTYRRALATLASAPNGAGSLDITVPDAARSYFIACLCRDLYRPVLLITAKPEDADRLSDNLATIFGQEDEADGGDAFSILRLPESESLPYERLAENTQISHRRLNILSALLQRRQQTSSEPVYKQRSGSGRQNHMGQGIALVASVAALSQRVLSPKEFEDVTHVLEIGQSIQTGPLLTKWAAMGYILEATVEVPGTASRRGGILDIFPPSESQPFRIELFGDIIEDIRPFNPLTQRSSPTVQRVTITPALDRRGITELGGAQIAEKLDLEVLLDQLSSVQQTTEALQRMREDLERLRNGEVIAEASFYAGFLCDGSVTDYLPSNSVVVVVEPDRVAQEAIELETQAENLRIAKVARNELPENFPSPNWPWNQVEKHFIKHVARLDINWLTASKDRASARRVFKAVPAPSFWGKLDAFATAVGQRARDGYRVVVLSNNAERLHEVLEGYGVGTKVLADLDEAPDAGTVSLVAIPLPEGMHLELSSGALLVFTDAEIFGHAKRRRSLRKIAHRREAFLTELVPGTYVVHVDHGVGKFTGVRKVSGDHGSREYLTLEYAEGDKLYVPSEHLNRLSPYLAPGDSSPTLTRLGSQEWTKAKERARTSAKEMAGELVALYAARQVLPGRAFSPDTVWQREMEDAFPYVETRDQLEAIDAIKDAMETPHPMDHLICGDVGYGKTEIAIRAAFKAVQDGVQVALLCPTTILAQQHYTTFTDRLSPYPVRIEVLSRFRTPQEQQETLKGLRNGRVDILIGTHRILQKDVAFKDLGLVVVDDEQRFGVTHKERFKQLRREVDVLTLTATPIPRTLSMALAGVRDMTSVHTPPEERLPVRTFVSEYEDSIVQEAILREMDRGGQVFFLHNRVRTIHDWANHIQELVPQAKVSVGHGRMEEDELEGVMAAFMDGKADVLVSTTIIEAGLDLPNANTIIVHRPELLGLAQMYQLRGRVGRGVRHAYAHFLIPPGTRMTEAAQKRLKAIVAYQELGSGFRIAMKDLEIRGAGNILGAEQSGMVHAVGFDLYTRLLEEAVADLKNQDGGEKSVRQVDPPEVVVDIPIEAFIPEDYIEDLPLRLGVYQRLARAADIEEAVIISADLQDRFGPRPEAVDNLIYVVRIKILAGDADVESVIREGGSIVIRLRHGVGGARNLLQRDLGTLARVGDSLVHLPIKGQWTEILVWLLERIGSFREKMLEMAEEANQTQC